MPKTDHKIQEELCHRYAEVARDPIRAHKPLVGS